MNEELLEIIQEKVVEDSSQPIYNSLVAETLNSVGKNPYRDGTIAAQSIKHVKSETGKTLMWSVCGDGDFGRDNDSIYANLIAHATDSESMAQIRNKLEDKGIDASSTPNEFNAVSSLYRTKCRRNGYYCNKR